jgi:arylsulfatase A-like enzyme
MSSPEPRRRSFARLGATLSGVAMLACQPSEPPSAAPPPNIVLAVIDTLRADRLPSYGYTRETAPRLAKLAAEGVLFERVIAASSWTKTSMASLLTSLDPNRHGVRRGTDVLPETLATLAEALREGGYRTVGINANPWLVDRYGFDRGFDVYESAIWSDARALNERALERASEGPEPLFLYLHYMDVHAPYTPEAAWFDEAPLALPGGERLPDAELERLYRKEGFDAPGVALRVQRLYDAEIRATDAALGDLLDGLEERGLLANAVVAVTSDHGEGFREHGTTEHGWNFYPEVYAVPLLIRAPGRMPAGERISAQVRSIDLAPSLLELAGLPVPPGFQGQSLLSPDGAPLRDRIAIGAIGQNDYLPDRDYVAVVSPDRLYIRERRSGEVELYDLRSDPGAQHDLGADHPEAKRLAELVPTEQAPVPKQVPIDPEAHERLRELGYVD